MYSRLLKFLIFLGLLSFFLPSNSTAQDRYFVQFVFQNDTQIDAVEADSVLQSFEVIYMSRTDLNTRNYLAICADELVFEIIKDYFVELGCAVSCQNSGIHGQDRIESLDPKKCGFQQVGEDQK
ncbi:MAG: hypothetical protein ACI84C_002181 [Flavobacteriales bacterium]|jgi:hypothetical protein